MFRASSVFRDCRITFFTRSPCGLCDTAKAVVQNVRTKRPFEYEEINVMETGQEKWRDAYEFDTPVVHIDRACDETSTSSLKVMHRIKESEVLKLIEVAERT